MPPRESDTLTAEVAPSIGSPGRVLAERYLEVRGQTEKLARPLAPEDCAIQSMPDASPTKWHLAHTSWFFEAFLLGRVDPGYRPFHPQFNYLFNSYYLSIGQGQRHCRPKRGLISRPTVEEVLRYRQYVDQHMLELLEKSDGRTLEQMAPIVEVGLNHEQQHQELMLTDIKHVFSVNPLRPAYHEWRPIRGRPGSNDMWWVSIPEGLHWIGHEGEGFAYDNETPRHRAFLNGFEIASRMVTSGEYLSFMEDGGYQRGDLWLSDGWNIVQSQGWQAPFYWEKRDGAWWTMTLGGIQRVEDAEPACHISFFEADAFARWAGARLPREEEWEVASAGVPIEGNFVESDLYHPAPSPVCEDGRLCQLFGDAWEWTGSAYLGYPGYRPPPGALGEYNGKFMCNQFVLRGGSCATPLSHIRRTYRNFFPPDARWQFTGFRLARDA